MIFSAFIYLIVDISASIMLLLVLLPAATIARYKHRLYFFITAQITQVTWLIWIASAC